MEVEVLKPAKMHLSLSLLVFETVALPVLLLIFKGIQLKKATIERIKANQKLPKIYTVGSLIVKPIGKATSLTEIISKEI